jgi:hypothetical protein
MNQLLLGASVPFTLALIIYLARGGRAGLILLILTPLAMALSALWAVAPDIPRLLGLHSLYQRLALDPRMDIFWWHYSIDRIEADSSWYAVGIALMAAALITAATRQLFMEEHR